ncbi:MAG TPA: hypothetical protein VK826_17180 [Bacteroidia bacterium]|nr:hypothetical protein [Bacteroidia bacterium]
MKIFHFLFSIFVITAVSCSNGEPDDLKNDSSLTDSMSVVEIETDSGKLVITKIVGQDLDAAVLYGKDGKIAGRGFLFNGRPSGAWIHYDANGNIIKAEHYSDGVVKYNLDVTDFQTVRMNFKEMGISLAVPAKWKAIETPNPANLISYEKEVTEEGILIMPNFNLACGKIEPGQTLEILAEQQMNMLHEVVGRVETVDESYVTVDSCRAFLRYGKYYTENNMVGFLDAIIIKGDKVWVISCAAQNREQAEFLKYQSVFENLVMSIQFLN